jgi:hypothetical protein
VFFLEVILGINQLMNPGEAFEIVVMLLVFHKTSFSGIDETLDCMDN